MEMYLQGSELTHVVQDLALDTSEVFEVRQGPAMRHSVLFRMNCLPLSQNYEFSNLMQLRGSLKALSNAAAHGASRSSAA